VAPISSYSSLSLTAFAIFPSTVVDGMANSGCFQAFLPIGYFARGAGC
jgi:hypothetical protein